MEKNHSYHTFCFYQKAIGIFSKLIEEHSKNPFNKNIHTINCTKDEMQIYILDVHSVSLRKNRISTLYIRVIWEIYSIYWVLWGRDKGRKKHLDS